MTPTMARILIAILVLQVMYVLGTSAPAAASAAVSNAAPWHAEAPQESERFGFVLIVSNTDDPAVLVAEQPSLVSGVWKIEPLTQRWLVYIPGAPDWLNTLRTSNLHVGDVVIMRITMPEVAPVTVVPLLSADLSYDPQVEDELLALVNRDRQARGIAPLVRDARLEAVARAHSADMWNRDFFSHTNPDGLSVFDRLRLAGITVSAAGENLAKTASTVRAHELMMDSELHRSILLNPRFTRVGIGVVRDATSNLVMFTQVFTD